MAHRPLVTILVFALLASATVALSSDPRTLALPLEGWDGLKLVNVRAEVVTYQGRRAVKVTEDPAVRGTERPKLVLVPVSGFADVVVEVDLAGKPGEGASGDARGFIGVAFRVAPDGSRYECFYLRPTNGRAEDQLRRNHSTQYVSEPDFPWHRARWLAPDSSPPCGYAGTKSGT